MVQRWDRHKKTASLLMLSCGLNTGVNFALATLLNQLIKPTLLFGDKIESSKIDKYIGYMGALSMVGIL